MALDEEGHKNLELAVDRMDEVVMLAAEILYRLDEDLTRGGFDVDRFEEEILRDFALKGAERTLFERSMGKYRKAIETTKQGLVDSDVFLEPTKLQLDRYEGIRASVDPRRPGVVIIHLKSQADAVQFDTDIEDENTVKFRAIAESLGATLTTTGRDKGRFIGKAVSLETLGLPPDLPVLSVIVVCDYAGQKVEGVTNHEYAHAVFNGLVTPFLHHYLSGKGRKDWPAQLPKDVREKLLSALGDLSTHTSDGYETETGEPKAFEVGLSQQFNVKLMSLPEKKGAELNRALAEEQMLLNEMRAYGFSHPGLPPTVQLTPTKLRKPTRIGELGVMDPKMVKRLFELHVQVTRATFSNREVFLRTLSILGASQSLDQAQRLVKNLLDTQEQLFLREVDFNSFLNFVTQFATGNLRGLFEYSLNGEPVLDEREVLRSLLPPKEMLTQAARTFYGEAFPDKVRQALALY